MWSTGEGNGKPLQYSCLENPVNSMKRQKDMTLKDELPRSVGALVIDREAWLPAVHGVAKSEMTGQMNNKIEALGFPNSHHDLSDLGCPTQHGS